MLLDNYNTYEGEMKSSLDNISAFDNFLFFLINGIKALQYQWKKCVNCKDDDVEK